MFNLSKEAIERSKEIFTSSKNASLPSICEGADVFDVLCPVSKRTGHRENPLSLLSKVLPPDKERLAGMILQEIPSVQQENPNISDSDAISLCVSRLSSGSKFEDEQVRRALLSVADVLFPESSVQKEQVLPDSSSVDVDKVIDNV